MKGEAGKSHRITQSGKYLTEGNRILECYLSILTRGKVKVNMINGIEVSSWEENTKY